jgi:hypothetical protein
MPRILSIKRVTLASTFILLQTGVIMPIKKIMPLLAALSMAHAEMSLLPPAVPVSDAVRTHLRFESIRPLELGDGHVYLTLNADGGAAASADYNERSTNEADVAALEWDGENLSGAVRITIGPDGARRGRAHFPSPPDVFELKFDAAREQAWAGFPLNRDAFMPGWRKDTPQVAGRAVRGTFAGIWHAGEKETEVSGDISGAWHPQPAPGAWGAVGPAWVGAGESGLQLTAFLPREVRVEGIEAWAELPLAEPVPVNSGGAVRVRAAGVAESGHAVNLVLQVRTERGWFTRHRVLRLTEMATEATVPLQDFGSDWRPFGGGDVRTVRVGVHDPRGVGRVDVTIDRLEILPGEELPSPGPVTVVVRPEVVRSFNGVDEVPKGLFGFHDVHENNPREPREGEPDPEEMMRILNPGSLRPLTHTVFGGKPLSEEELAANMDLKQRDLSPPDTPFFRRAVAGNAVDKVIWTHTMDLWARPTWMERGIEAVAGDVEVFYRNLASKAWIPGDDNNVLRYFSVWNEPFMWGRHINMGFRVPPGANDIVDETQFGYIPGKVGADAWSEIFRAAVRGARAVNPYVKLGGPSAPDFGSHDYMDFRNYTMRILEAVGDQLDFISEHHYGGNPLTIAAGYEVTRSAMKKLHGRMVPIFNTEANDLGASDAGKAAYNLADILNLIRVNPDISRVRALHATWYGYLRSQGEEHAWRLAAPLRGRLIDVVSSQPRLTVVASHPEPGDIVVVGVDHGLGETDVQIPMPAGFRVRELTLLLSDAPLSELLIRDVDGAMIPERAQGKTELVEVTPQISGGFLRFTLSERSAFRAVLERDGFEPMRVREQSLHTLPILFEELEPGESLSLQFEDKTPGIPERLFLRIVHTGNVRVEADGKALTRITGADRPSNAVVQDIELPVTAIHDGAALIAETPAEVLSVSWIFEGL